MNRYLIGLVALIVVGVGIFVYNSSPKNTFAVSLGVIAGTTGDYAAAGEGYLKGFELARAEWNSSHSLQFSDIVEDDGFNAQKGVAAYTKIKSIDKPNAYAIVSSFTIDAIMGNLHTEGLPVALGFEQSTSATDDNIFQVLPAARPIIKGLGSYAKEAGYKKPVLLVSSNTPVYQNFAAGFVDGYGNGQIIETINGSNATSIRAVATKVLAEKPDIVTFFMDPPAGALLAKELIVQSKGTHPQFAFEQSVESGKTDYQKVFGQNLVQLDGSIIVLSKNDLTEQFKTLYKNKYQADPPFGADMGYNAFTLLATTYAPVPQAWIANMKKADFTGADGKVSFDQTGLRVPNLAIGTLQKGEVVLK